MRWLVHLVSIGAFSLGGCTLITEFGVYEFDDGGGSGIDAGLAIDSGPTEELAALARGADLFLCEATLADPGKDGRPRGHLSADEAIATADGPILLTHRPVELPPPDGVPVARDGLVVEV